MLLISLPCSELVWSFLSSEKGLLLWRLVEILIVLDCMVMVVHIGIPFGVEVIMERRIGRVGRMISVTVFDIHVELSVLSANFCLNLSFFLLKESFV